MPKSKRKYKQILIILGLIAVATLVLRTPKAEQQSYIAHYAGKIDGVGYTNSLEAIENSIAKGMRHIEIDLIYTSDDSLVAVHDWEKINRMNGQDSNAPMTYREFKNSKIMGKYTPLDATQVDSVMLANPTITLVTDKTSDPEVLNKYFSNIRDRVIVEAVNPDNYFELKKSGYKKVLHRNMLPLSQWIEAAIKHKGIVNTFVCYHEDYGNRSVLRKMVDNLFNCKYALYAVESKALADSIMERHSDVEFVYINRP